MTDLEDVRQSLESLKICAVTDIHKYFSHVVDVFRFLPKSEKKECAESFYQWAKENAVLNPIKFGYAEFFLGLQYHLNDEHDAALHSLTDARKHFEKQNNPEGIGLCAVITGSIYRTFGNFDLALKTSLEGYNLLKRFEHYRTFLSGCTIGIANINLELHNYDEALKMFTVTYDESEKANDDYFMVYALHGLGKTNMRLEKYAEAKEFFEHALLLAKKNNRPLAISNSLTELANFYFHFDHLPEAEQFNREALVIREKNKYTGGAVTNCIHLGEILIRQKRLDEAMEVLNKGLALAEQIKVKPKIYQVHFLLSGMYQGKNEPEKSLHHFKLFHSIRSQVEQEDNVRKLSDAKLIFEAEQTRNENITIKKQKEEIAIKNSELQKTIDELTRTKISRKAKTLTLTIAIILFIIQDFMLGFVLEHLPGNNYFLSLVVKMAIIFSLSPINKAIERYLLRKVIKDKKETASVFEQTI